MRRQRMKFFCFLLIGLLCAVSFIPSWAKSKKVEEVQKTGTFSSLRYSNNEEEEDDLLGMELRIVYCGALGREGYQGTIQFAEGAPEELILIKNIQISENNKISFIFVDEDSGNSQPITFIGKISEKKITGSFSNQFYSDFNGLKRTKSFWD